MIFKKSLLLVAIAASAFSAQAQNIVVNGSFEQVTSSNAQNAGTWSIYKNIIGWTGNPNIEVRDKVAGTTPFGSNFVELDTTKNSHMYQDITGNGWYELSFWYAARQGVAAGSNGLGFTFGNLAGTVLQNTAGNAAGTVWTKYTGNVLLSGTTRLEFYANGRSDSYGGSLDNISVTAVPEPESLAMMLAGLGLMGTIARRRKLKAA